MSEFASSSKAALVGGALATVAASYAMTTIVRDYIFRLQAQAELWSDVVEQSAPVEDEGDEEEWYKPLASSTPTIKTVSLPVEPTAAVSRHPHARSDSNASASTEASSTGVQTPATSEAEYFDEVEKENLDGIFIPALPRTQGPVTPRSVCV